jgi:hypothetical protein
MILKLFMLIQAAFGPVGFPAPALEAAFDLVGRPAIAFAVSIVGDIPRVLIGIVLGAAGSPTLALCDRALVLLLIHWGATDTPLAFIEIFILD